MIIPVWLHHKDNPQREILVYALLDDASDTTFIKSQTLRDLGLCGPEIKLTLHTMLEKEEITVERMNDLVVKRVDKSQSRAYQNIFEDKNSSSKEPDPYTRRSKQVAAFGKDRRQALSLSK